MTSTLTQLKNRLNEEFNKIEAYPNKDKRRENVIKILSDYSGKDYEEYISYSEVNYNKIKLTKYCSDKFDVYLICWFTEQETKIHDHPEQGCWMKVLRGELHESAYTICDDYGNPITGKIDVGSLALGSDCAEELKDEEVVVRHNRDVVKCREILCINDVSDGKSTPEKKVEDKKFTIPPIRVDLPLSVSLPFFKSSSSSTTSSSNTSASTSSSTTSTSSIGKCRFAFSRNIQELYVSYRQGQTTLHKIKNSDSYRVAVSLHIYSPPNYKPKLFVEMK